MMIRLLALFVLAALAFAAPIPAQDNKDNKDKDKDNKKKIDVDQAIEKGLEWLKRNQAADGHWDANGVHTTTMTALAGMCFLMEGSTLKEGKYCDQLVKAVNWFMARQQQNGLLGNVRNPTESQRYMYGHGFGLMFLACVYGEEEDNERRKKLEGILKKAAQFCSDAQTDRGGWGYVSAKDGSNFDEGSVTITQLQALRAARNAGITVKKQTVDEAIKYLHKCTTPKGGIIYSLANGGANIAGQERPPLTAAAIACAFSAGEYANEDAKKWIQYCKEHIPIGKGSRSGHDEYQAYYFSQAMYVLGEDRYGNLFPTSAKNSWMTWSSYRESLFEYLKSQQNADGSWTSGYIGPVFSTAVNLTILQLEKGILPIYHR